MKITIDFNENEVDFEILYNNGKWDYYSEYYEVNERGVVSINGDMTSDLELGGFDEDQIKHINSYAERVIEEGLKIRKYEKVD